MESPLWIVITAGLLITLFWRSHQWSRLMDLLQNLAEAVDKRQPFLVEQEASRLLSNKELRSLQHSLNKLITSHVKDSRRRIENAQLIKTMLDRVEEALFVIRSDNRIVLSNKAAQRFFAQDGERLIGQHIDGLLHSAKLLEYLQDIRNGRKLSQEAIEVRRASGSSWFQISAAPLPDAFKEHHRVFMVLYDITRIKRLEEVRTEFVANVSHELRTPLTVIRGFVDMLAADVDSMNQKQRRGFLKRIQKNVQRLHYLIEDLFLLSRLELEPQTFIQREPYSLKMLITEVVDDYRSRYQAHSLPLISELDPEPIEVPLDPLRIKQVFENLLDNAHCYAKGAKRITVVVKAEKDYVVCSVQDDGCGIPPTALPHIFERLYRVDRDRSRESGGTGLGLSIVKHIVQQHGGSVAARSTEGIGTRIEFTLPRRRDAGFSL